MTSITNVSTALEINKNKEYGLTPTSWLTITQKLTSMQIHSDSSQLLPLPPGEQSLLTIYSDRLDHFGGTNISNINFTSSRIRFVEAPESADVLYLIDHTYGDNDDQEYNKFNKVSQKAGC